MDDKIKQVILIRRDLKMRRGKEIAQGAHASMAVLVDPLLKKENEDQTSVSFSQETLTWFEKGMAKITLQVQSEEDLLDRFDKAQKAGILCSLIRDSGRTEFSGIPTLTACALGPARSSVIDAITGDLKLY